MPKIGQKVSCKELGKKRNGSYYWLPCPSCGQPRWVRSDQVKEQHPCRHCHMIKLNRNAPSGERHWNWKGRRVAHGYILVKIAKDSPFISMANIGGYIPEHRFVMAQALGRPLQQYEWVHHKNENRQDNRIENLKIVDHRTHGREHLITNWELRKEIRLLRLQVKNLQEQMTRLEAEVKSRPY